MVSSMRISRRSFHIFAIDDLFRTLFTLICEGQTPSNPFELELTVAVLFGFNAKSEYNVIVNSVRGGKAERLTWDDITVACGNHGRLLDFYANRKAEK